MRTMRVVVLGLLVAGCRGDAGVSTSAAQLTDLAVDAGPTMGTVGPVAVPLGCASVFTEAPVVAADWASTRLESCQTAVTHTPMQVYDDCKGPGWTITDCDLPWGSQFCFGGYWTVLCRADGDCPGETRCTWGEGVGTVPVNADGTYSTYGWCAKTCTSESRPMDCVRCDLECDKELGVCVHPSNFAEADADEHGHKKDKKPKKHDVDAGPIE
jgi:hypothetical protein